MTDRDDDIIDIEVRQSSPYAMLTLFVIVLSLGLVCSGCLWAALSSWKAVAAAGFTLVALLALILYAK